MFNEQASKTTALYYRVASKQSHELYLDNQMHKLLCYASEQGLDSFKLYADVGVSGLTLDRPGFNALKADIEAGNIDKLIIKDITRIGRDMFLTGQFIEWAQTQGITIHSVIDGEIKLYAPTADFIKSLSAAVRQLPKGGVRA